MDTKTKKSPQNLINSETCSHYWVIETPSGAICNGICRFCGEKKEFASSFESIKPENIARRPGPKNVSTVDEYFG
ncbi:hypothetical protein ACFLTP_09600 [Chloroflexota bacterium]